MVIVFLATAWGPKWGGINSFNQDLACAVAKRIGAPRSVFCTACTPTEEEVRDAESKGVTIIPVPAPQNTDRVTPAYMNGVWRQISAICQRVDFWIGHDVISGWAALDAASAYGGRAAIIHHMSYASYQGLKSGNSQGAQEKHEEQKRLFRKSALLFGVGPLLVDSCTELSGSATVVELIPGFPEAAQPNTSTNDRLVAIAFGRMDIENDRLKQGRLALAGFSDAIKKAADIGIDKFANCRFLFVGLDGEPDDEIAVRQWAQQYAGRAVNVLALKFDNDRQALFDKLSECNLSFMLSIHEGFGLSGWEAIAAEIPLIASKNSGVYKVIERELGGAGVGCINWIEVGGAFGGKSNFNADDLASVSRAVMKVSNNIGSAKKDARTIRELLINKLGCSSWDKTATQFLHGIGIEIGAQAVNDVVPTNCRHSGGPVFTAQSTNRVPECAELAITTTQGSTPKNFDLLPELRFGKTTIEHEGLSITYGLLRAELRAQLNNCRILTGHRYGDSATDSPNVVAQGGNLWEIIGPKENGILRRLALGHEPLCSLAAESGLSSSVSLMLSCLQRDISYEIDVVGEPLSLTKQRIMEIFLNKCMSESASSNGKVALSTATLCSGGEG